MSLKGGVAYCTNKRVEFVLYLNCIGPVSAGGAVHATATDDFSLLLLWVTPT